MKLAKKQQMLAILKFATFSVLVLSGTYSRILPREAEECLHWGRVNVRSSAPKSAPEPDPAVALGDPQLGGEAVQGGLYTACIRGLARSTCVHT